MDLIMLASSLFGRDLFQEQSPANDVFVVVQGIAIIA